MRRCFQLARLGEGRVAPNPLVGCVIATDDGILSEGYHRQFGGAHAEVNALNALTPAGRSQLGDATVFVNLEPCSHYGKTPPCADRLIAEGVRRVVVCNTDPNPQVSGRGLRKLRDAGVQVEEGLLTSEGWELNRRFFTYHELKRPYITLKWAETADGYLDADDPKPIRISSDLTKALVHKLRATEQAILVGTRTLLKDNPSLHTRRYYGAPLTRLAIDRNGRAPLSSHLLDGSQPTFLFNSRRDDAPWVRLDFDGDVIQQLLQFLYDHRIQSLIVEGGAETLRRFIVRGLYDAVQVETGVYACGKGTQAPDVPLGTALRTACYDGHRMVSFRKMKQ
ncbi:MAG: bifunctional diaminohydroxyphosphoribosylaminopyrimidine deaminase/5-amino-6-(5-phosphoribosylamino)uracil reductase RibD [Paludibacteraceae bacterium]|nr:bifunctional diaminohydroxyphosphoribosylaminopyrimidine deaminase/5-amino-6-(5-phosphoribosylamino)uracil reductase RibD [Paludibacteraceae bacterium]